MATFVALRCYACGMFQVKQLKRSSNKWSCCICNEKQSVCKVYGRSGAAKDIRKLVQTLNLSKREEQPSLASETQDEVLEDEPGPAGVHCGESKWKDFLDEDITRPECGDEEGAEHYVTVLPEARRSKRKALSGCCVRSSKATSRASVENSSISAGSLKQLGVPAFFKSDRSKDLKLETAAGKENSLPPCNGTSSSRFMNSTTTGSDTGNGRDDNNVAVRAQDKDKYAVKPSSSKWNEYLEDGQKQQPDDFGTSSSKVSGVYRKWSTFQQELCLGGAMEIGTELEDEVVAEDDVHPSFLLRVRTDLVARLVQATAAGETSHRRRGTAKSRPSKRGFIRVAEGRPGSFSVHSIVFLGPLITAHRRREKGNIPGVYGPYRPELP